MIRQKQNKTGKKGLEKKKLKINPRAKQQQQSATNIIDHMIINVEAAAASTIFFADDNLELAPIISIVCLNSKKNRCCC